MHIPNQALARGQVYPAALAMISQRVKIKPMLGQLDPASATIIAAAAGGGGPEAAASSALTMVQKIINIFFSQTHILANDFVQQIQNPMTAQLATIVDAKDAAVNNGTATIQTLTTAKAAIAQWWSAFQAAASRFGLQGTGYAKVAQQGLNTLNGANGMPGFPNGFINTVLSKIDGQIAALGGTPTATTLPIVAVNPVTGTTTTTNPVTGKTTTGVYSSGLNLQDLSQYFPYLLIGGLVLLAVMGSQSERRYEYA